MQILVQNLPLPPFYGKRLLFTTIVYGHKQEESILGLKEYLEHIIEMKILKKHTLTEKYKMLSLYPITTI